MTPTELMTLYKRINQFDKHLDFDLQITESGVVTYEVLIEDKHLSSPGTCHGGVLAGLMDNVLGVTALAHAVTEDKLCSTVEFKINYLNPALKGDRVFGEALIDHRGQTIVVTSGTLKTKDKLIAKGLGTFNLYPASKKDFFSLETKTT
jgi:uncharacterized protein (TIGR00369 family)